MMSPEMEQSLIRVVKFASAHSQEHRLSDYTLGPLTNEQIFAIGTDLVRLFEARYKAEMKKAPPAKPEAPFGSSGTPRARQRRRGRDQ